MKYKEFERHLRLISNGCPKNIKVYDNNETFDRYTVVYTGRYAGRPLGVWEYIGMSENPFHPQGFGQHGELNHRPGAYLGKSISFWQLPLDCQKLVLNEYKEIWNLDYKVIWNLTNHEV